jgi:hypothetical protein
MKNLYKSNIFYGNGLNTYNRNKFLWNNVSFRTLKFIMTLLL